MRTISGLEQTYSHPTIVDEIAIQFVQHSGIQAVAKTLTTEDAKTKRHASLVVSKVARNGGFMLIQVTLLFQSLPSTIVDQDLSSREGNQYNEGGWYLTVLNSKCSIDGSTSGRWCSIGDCYIGKVRYSVTFNAHPGTHREAFY